MTEAIETPSTLARKIGRILRAAFAGDDRAANAERDARLLVGHALGLDATGLVVHGGRRIEPSDVARAMAYAERRKAGEPVARIIGEKDFWTLRLALSPETLVPRPDTETVVSAALDWVRAARRESDPIAILDLGTGSGAILLALLSELPNARGVGLDRSFGAARTARENAVHHGLDARARFVTGDWANALSGRFDLVVSNPPYIPSADIGALAVDVRVHDPDIALDGGFDGLAAYRIILNSLDPLLASDGMAALEVGAGQADSVAALALQRGFEASQVRDIAGIDRVVKLRRGKASRQKIGLEIQREPDRFRSP